MDKNYFTGKKIAFLGDSITLGYALENKADRFSAVVCKRLGAIEANYGVTGTLVARAGMNRGDGKAFIDRLSLTNDADFLVIFGGTNDYFWSDRPIEGEDGEDYFRVAVDKILENALKHHSPRDILVVTPYPHNGIGNFLGGEAHTTSSRHDTDQKNFNGHILEEYVDILEDVATEMRIPVLNLHKIQGFDWKLHTSDGCHPNPVGHLWLADTIEKKLLNL